MKKALLPAATALVAIGVAGCGGGSSNKTLSYSDFGKQANAICKSENPKIQAIGGKITGDPKTDAPVYDQLLPALKSAQGKLEALKAPDKLKPTADQLKALDAQQYAATQKAQAAAKAGDGAGEVAAIKSLKPLDQQSDLLASKAGAGECISK